MYRLAAIVAVIGMLSFISSGAFADPPVNATSSGTTTSTVDCDTWMQKLADFVFDGEHVFDLFAPATADLNRNGMLVGRSES